MSNLPVPAPPDRRRARLAILRSSTSPSAVVATAVGAGIGLLDRSVVLAVVLAVCGWTGRMGAAVVGHRRRASEARRRRAPLDPWSLPEPWRQLLQQAQAAQNRFDQAVEGWPPGPTRDRLVELQPRLWEEVRQLGAAAQHGAAVTGWPRTTTSSRPSPAALAQELRQVQDERARLGDSSPARTGELTRREEAVAAQLRALHRAQEAQAQIYDRVRLAVARLDEKTTDILTVEAPGTGTDPSGVSSTLDELSDGITSLRAALSEAAGPPPDPGTP